MTKRMLGSLMLCVMGCVAEEVSGNASEINEDPHTDSDDCGDVDLAGYCDGNTAVWCERGALTRLDCPTLGSFICSVFEPAVSYFAGEQPLAPAAWCRGNCEGRPARECVGESTLRICADYLGTRTPYAPNFFFDDDCDFFGQQCCPGRDGYADCATSCDDDGDDPPPEACGNAVCADTETCSSCAVDCACPGGTVCAGATCVAADDPPGDPPSDPPSDPVDEPCDPPQTVLHGDRCVPSCGAAGGNACGAACDGLPLREAYDCGRCCNTSDPRETPVCDPPHSILVDGHCVPSCGTAGGNACGSDCDGYEPIESWDCEVCCQR